MSIYGNGVLLTDSENNSLFQTMMAVVWKTFLQLAEATQTRLPYSG